MFYHVLADIVVCNTVNYFIMIELFISLDARQALRVHLVDQCRSYQLQAAIFHEALFSSGAESNITSLHPFFSLLLEQYCFITLPPSNITFFK